MTLKEKTTPILITILFICLVSLLLVNACNRPVRTARVRTPRPSYGQQHAYFDDSLLVCLDADSTDLFTNKIPAL